jgi:hypothetical protein
VALAAKKDIGGFRWDGANLRWVKDSRVSSDRAMVTIQPKTGVAYTVSRITTVNHLPAPALCSHGSVQCIHSHRPQPTLLQAWPVVQLTLANEGLKSVVPAEAQALSRKGWTLVDVRLADKYELDSPQVSRLDALRSLRLEQLSPWRGDLPRSPHRPERAAVYQARASRRLGLHAHARLQGAVNVPLYRYVEGDGFWDNAKRLAMAGFAMKATERVPEYAAAAQRALKKNQKAGARGPGARIATASGVTRAVLVAR